MSAAGRQKAGVSVSIIVPPLGVCRVLALFLCPLFPIRNLDILKLVVDILIMLCYAACMNKYRVIYADPPWTFKTYSPKGKEKKSPELHYECMRLEDIYNLPVRSIAEDDCVLFLWVTAPMLKQG
jgi:hypothetical protein